MRSSGTRGIKREREKLPRQTRSSRPSGRPRRDAHGPARDAAAVPVPVPVPAPPPPSRARLRDPGAGPLSLWGCAAGYGAPAAAARAGAWRSPSSPRRSRWSGAYRATSGTRVPSEPGRGCCEVTPRGHPALPRPRTACLAQGVLSSGSLVQILCGSSEAADAPGNAIDWKGKSREEKFPEGLSSDETDECGFPWH